MVASHDDYRMVLHSETTRLLCSVAFAVLLCPIAEYLFCAKKMVSERLYSHLQGNTHEALMNGLFMIYLVLRYGTLPCLLTAFSSAIMSDSFSCDDHLHHAALNVWDKWIERWIKAYERENKAKEDRYMAVMKDIEPCPFGSGGVFNHFPELIPDRSWEEKYKGFGSESVRTS